MITREEVDKKLNDHYLGQQGVLKYPVVIFKNYEKPEEMILAEDEERDF